MSEGNVELARGYCETFNAHGLDGVQPLWHPEIEVYDPPDVFLFEDEKLRRVRQFLSRDAALEVAGLDE